MATATQPKPVAVAAPRMTLASILRGKRPAPDRVLIIGVEGVGKSTLAADAPDPIFIAAEDGIRYLDVAAFPEPKNLQDIYDAIKELTYGEHSYKTLVIDTIDFVEPLILREICRRDGVSTIEAVGSSDGTKKGFGKGYDMAREELRLLLGRLDGLRERRGMEIIILGHAQVATFENPTGDNYSRYELAMNKKAALILKAWADTVLFATFQEVTTDPKKGKVKGISTGARIMYTERASGFDAKNRSSLPPVLPLSYEEYAAARAAGLQVNTNEVLDACLAIIKTLELPPEHPAAAFVEAKKDNPAALVKALNRLRAIAAETETVKE